MSLIGLVLTLVVVGVLGAFRPYQASVSPGLGSQIDRGSSSSRATSAAIRRGGSSYASWASSNVPQWMPMNLVDRRSREACSASSGDMWTGRAISRGV